MTLVSRAKNGDQEAFATLMEENKLYMYKTAKTILGNEEDVYDAIQDALISIYKGIGTLKDEKHLKTWMIRITMNKCYDIITKNNMARQKVVKFSNYVAETEEGEYEKMLEGTELERTLNLIDEDLRLCTVLYYYNELSIKAIANLMNIPEGTVKSKLSRAREKLYAILKEGVE